MTGCACVYCPDYEPIEPLSTEMVRARKPHNCGECGRRIQAGEQYERTNGKYDGDFVCYKTCVDCLSIRNAFFCDGWGFHAVWRDLHEHLMGMCSNGDSVSSECLKPLTKPARDKVCDAIEKIWEEWADDDE